MSIEKTGNCFYNAYLAIQEWSIFEKATLVHAVVRGTGGEVKDKAYTHGWLEMDNVAYDFTHKKLDCEMLCKDAYHKLGRIYPATIARYTRGQAIDQYKKFDHTGPWHSFITHVGKHEPMPHEKMLSHIEESPTINFPNPTLLRDG